MSSGFGRDDIYVLLVLLKQKLSCKQKIAVSLHRNTRRSLIQTFGLMRFYSVFHLALDASVHDSCKFCNSRIALQFPLTIDIGYVATDSRFVFVKQEPLLVSILANIHP